MDKSEFDAVLIAINEAALLCEEEGDFLSFSTLLDHHLSDWGVYNSAQRLELLELIIAKLEEDDELMEEIGWDLPALVFPFVDQDWPIDFSLQKQPFIKVFWNFCDLMARKGQPKELLLSCCEMLANLEDPIVIDPTTIPEDLDNYDKMAIEETPIKCFSLKFHALLQIISSCLLRNETLNPSRFLSKVVVSIINFYKAAPEMSHHNIVVRRIHGFIRDYLPPGIPSNEIDSFTEDELITLQDDEAYLQRKLLIFLLTLTIDNVFKANPGFMLSCICPQFLFRPMRDNLKPILDIFNRLYSLAISLDLDIPGLLFNEVKELNKAFDSNNNGEMKTSEAIFKHVINVYNSTYLREKLPSTLPISPSALLCLYIYGKYYENALFKLPGELDAMEIIKFQLQLFLPYTIESKLSNISSVFCSMVWLLGIVQGDISKSHDLLSRPENVILVSTSLQTVSGVLITSEYISLRKFLVNYLGKLLRVLPENQCWEFIIDTLKECPYESFVIDSINILKELVKKDRYSVDELITDVESVKIDDKTPKPPPRLPQKFITLDDSRKAEIITLFDIEIKIIFNNGNSFHYTKANKLLSYINFINSVEFDKNDVEKRVNDIKGYLSKFKDSEDVCDKTVIGLIEFAIRNTKIVYKF